MSEAALNSQEDYDSDLSDEEKDNLAALLEEYAASLSDTERPLLFEMMDKFASDLAGKNYREGWNKARNKAWVPLRSLKPPPDTRVLTYSPTADGSRERIAIAVFHQAKDKGQWWQLERDAKIIDRGQVTHWQSLPSAPNKPPAERQLLP